MTVTWQIFWTSNGHSTSMGICTISTYTFQRGSTHTFTQGIRSPLIPICSLPWSFHCWQGIFQHLKTVTLDLQWMTVTYYQHAHLQIIFKDHLQMWSYELKMKSLIKHSLLDCDMMTGVILCNAWDTFIEY